MLARSALFLSAVALFSVLTLGGCAGTRNPEVTLENKSTAVLQVEVALPSRGIFGRKSGLESFRTLLPAGGEWSSSPDTLRFASEPNDVKGFRVTVTDLTGGAKRPFDPFTVTDGRKFLHLVFRGQPGAITWEPLSESGASAGEQTALVPEPLTAQ